jgi:hypothetical protein
VDRAALKSFDPLRGRLGARALGQLYARAGLVFRIVESDQVPEAALTAHPMQVTNRWRWPAE